MAIADVVDRHALDDLAVIHSSFGKYEQLRRPLIKVQDATMHNHNWSEKWSIELC